MARLMLLLFAGFELVDFQMPEVKEMILVMAALAVITMYMQGFVH